ncbi:MAG: response regulator [Gammaproteobacteria bacterium]|nr:response regulator [Gammaproteobacteria bacterium]
MNTKPNLQARNILIVDDDIANLKIMAAYLRESGYDSMMAENGKDALEKAQSGSPDLILMDVLMPGMNGFEACQHMKSSKNIKDIPVLFMTALSDIENKLKGFDAGGVDYITKPIQEREMLARIDTHLTLQSLRKSLEEKNTQLQKTLDEVSTLRGILPICASCKKIRDDKGYWNQIEAYIENHSDALFSHGLCPGCEKKFYGDEKWYKKRNTQ